MASLPDLIREYIQVKDRRLELDKQSKEIKDGREQELVTAILAEMSAQGIKSANLEGIGRVVSKTTYHWEITDIEALAQQMFRKMLEAAQAGRPFSDGLLLQRRVNKESLETFLESAASTIPGSGPEADEAAAVAFGVKNVARNDLSFSRTTS